jgi:hypothetical protein
LTAKALRVILNDTRTLNIKDLEELMAGPNIKNISRDFYKNFNDFAFQSAIGIASPRSGSPDSSCTTCPFCLDLDASVFEAKRFK